MTLANVLVAVAIVLALAVAVICLAIYQTIRNFQNSPPKVDTSTPQDTAKELAQNFKWGFLAIDKAVEYGDAILPFLQKETENFTDLNCRNAEWIAEVLGRIPTENSRAILQELYSGEGNLLRTTGAVGLALLGIVPEPIHENHFLVQAILQDDDQAILDHEIELAIIALGHSKSVEALPCLFGVLENSSAGWWKQSHACEALGRIGSESAIPILKDCLQSFQFHALPQAFRALIALGDKEAIPLAIARITGSNSGSLVKELKNVTGVSFEYNRHLWLRWWDFAGPSWQIPDRFRSMDA